MGGMLLEALQAGLPGLGLSLPQGAVETMCAFGQALLEKNQVMNLTAITEPEQVARLHFLDSLTLLTLTDFRQKRVIDVGCGGGFPGVPLKIACPEMQLTLLDSLGKRMAWLSETLPGLGIEADCVTARAEKRPQPGGSSIMWLCPGRLPGCRSCVSCACPMCGWAACSWP